VEARGCGGGYEPGQLVMIEVGRQDTSYATDGGW
jgi:hypothetical protein